MFLWIGVVSLLKRITERIGEDMEYEYIDLPKGIVTRRYCDGGRWIDIGTPIYLIPIQGASLLRLRLYKTVLTLDHDTYKNTVCINEDEAIRDIKAQMNIFQWIMAYFL